MSEGVMRTVRLGSIAYVNSEGQVRWAENGSEVSVHKDAVESFDRLNVLLGDEPPKPEPARRRTSKAKSED